VVRQERPTATFARAAIRVYLFFLSFQLFVHEFYSQSLHLFDRDRWASNFVPSKTYVNHYGIDDMTGTFSKEKLATSNPRSKSITMMRGRLAGK
jgi:hypothetical protein